MSKRILCFLSATTLLISGAAWAQAPAPAKYIRIFREEVKVGKGAAHEKFEVAYPQAFAKASWPRHYIAMTSISGPGEAWFIEGHDSMASIEQDEQASQKNAALQAELEGLSARDADFISSLRVIVARYREDLSYRASPPNLAKARYMWVYTDRIRPGHRNDYEQSVKMDASAYEKAKITNERWACYQVVMGAPAGTYLYFGPMTSLSEADVDNSKAYDEAMGEDNRARYRQITRDGVISGESQVFALSPKMSYVSKEFAAVDPEYWTPKPLAAKVPAKAKAETPAKKP